MSGLLVLIVIKEFLYTAPDQGFGVWVIVSGAARGVFRGGKGG